MSFIFFGDKEPSKEIVWKLKIVKNYRIFSNRIQSVYKSAFIQIFTQNSNPVCEPKWRNNLVTFKDGAIIL